MAKEPSSLHSPFSEDGWGLSSNSKDWESVRAVAVADATAAMMVEEGMSTPIERTEEAVAIAEERMLVGVAFSRGEAKEGSKPGGGCMSQVGEGEVVECV